MFPYLPFETEDKAITNEAIANKRLREVNTNQSPEHDFRPYTTNNKVAYHLTPSNRVPTYHQCNLSTVLQGQRIEIGI